MRGGASRVAALVAWAGAGDRLALHSLMVAGAGGLAGVLALGFRLIVGSQLSPAEFGLVFSLVAVVDFALVVRGGIQLSIARGVSVLRADRDASVLRAMWITGLRRYALIGAAAFAVTAVLSPLVARLLHFDSVVYVVIAASGAVPVLLVAVNAGVLQGLQRFTSFAAISVAIPAARLLVALLLLALGAGVVGALVAYVSGGVAAFLLGAVLLRELWLPQSAPRGDGGGAALGNSLPAFVTTVGLAGLLTGDVVLARVFLEAEAAGVYAAVATLGSVVLVGTAGVAVALFPKATRTYEEGGRPSTLLWLAVAYSAAIGLVAMGFVWLSKDFLLGTLFGPEYGPGADYAVLYMGVMTVVSLFHLLAHYALSVELYQASAVAVAAAVLQIVMVLVWHGDGPQIAALRLATALVAVVASGVLLLRAQRAAVPVAPANP